MSNRRIGRVSPTSPTSPSAPVDVGQTHSILTDPDARWVAKRQSDINAALEKRAMNRSVPGIDDDGFSQESGSADKAEGPVSKPENSHARLSGESERIGKGNLGAKTPFGKHVGYL
jgi:hypothetical protein